MSNRSLADALKAMRRQFYVHGPSWRPLIIAEHPDNMKAAFKETLHILESSSMFVSEHEYVFADRPWIKMDADKVVRFGVVNCINEVVRKPGDAYMFAGTQYTHLMWLYEPDQTIRGYMRSVLRSPVEGLECIDEVVDF